MARHRRPSNVTSPTSQNSDLADLVGQQIQQDADHIVRGLQGDFQPADSVPVSQDTNDEYVRQGWSDPQFRANLLDRVGPDELINQYHSAFGLPMPSDDDIAVAVGAKAPDRTIAGAAVKAVRDVQRDGAGRIQRVVDYAGPQAEQIAQQPPSQPAQDDQASQSGEADAQNFMQQMAGGGT